MNKISIIKFNEVYQADGVRDTILAGDGGGRKPCAEKKVHGVRQGLGQWSSPTEKERKRVLRSHSLIIENAHAPLLFISSTITGSHCHLGSIQIVF